MTNYFIDNTIRLAKHNVKIVFGGKFAYFILAALVFFLLFGTIMAFEENYIEVYDIYNVLLLPAILLVFYPSAFGIQSDADQRTLEIIFGIPDYRYKVWLVRLLMVLVICFVLLFPFAAIAHYALMSISIFKMVTQLMVVVILTSTLGFCVSTLVKSGNATAVILVVIGLIFFFSYEALEESKWNLFLNPFYAGFDGNDIIWQQTLRQNRIILLVSSVIFLLIGLLNLQKREKFLR